MLRPSAPMIKLKSPREIGLMREAGRVVAKALDRVRQLAVPGATTADLDEAVRAIFREHAAIPLFLNYPNPTKGKRPFPAVVCASVNEQVVHGIPSRRPLQSSAFATRSRTKSTTRAPSPEPRSTATVSASTAPVT